MRIDSHSSAAGLIVPAEGSDVVCCVLRISDRGSIYGARTRAAAEAAIDVFADKYGAKYDKAIACLTI